MADAVAASPPRHGRAGARRAAPAVVLVLTVAGAGMGAVVATSLGLMPLYGRPRASLAGYAATAPELTAAVRETLVIASASTLLAGVTGLLLASVILGHGPGRRIVHITAAAVLAVPHLVGAASVGLLLADGGVAARLSGVEAAAWPSLVAGPWPVATVVEFAWKESAFVALVIVAAIGRGQRLRVETAAVLGAGPWHRWSRVYLPSAFPALAAASLIVFLFTVGSYEVAWLLGRAHPEPLPVMAYRLFGSIDLAARPAAAAAATLGAGVAVLAALAAAATAPRLRTALGPASSSTRDRVPS